MVKPFRFLRIFKAGFSMVILTSSLQAVEGNVLNPPMPTSTHFKPQIVDNVEDEDKINAWKKEALQLADEYVKDLDKGQYAKSWEKGGPIFQNTVSRSDWVKAIYLTRQPLGKMNSRILQYERLIKDPYNLLKGNFIALEYHTSFQRESQARELLVLRRDSEGKWYVVSYEVFYALDPEHGPSDEKRKIWKEEAAQAAKNYVTDLDQGRYAETWEKGGILFQSTITKANWVKNLDLTRKPFGKVLSRALEAEHIISDPYDPTEGIFMVIEYQTAFENAPQGREHLILRLGPNDEWRVGSYEVYRHTMEKLPEK